MAAKPSLTPWSIKGVSSKARKLAKQEATAQNMTMGQWLTMRICEEALGQVSQQAAGRPEGQVQKDPNQERTLAEIQELTAQLNKLRGEVGTA